MKTGIVAFLSGILLIYQLPVLPELRLAFLAFPVVLLSQLIPGLQPIARLGFWLLLGITWAVFRADIVLSKNLPTELEGVDLIIEGTISEMPYVSHRRQRFDFDVGHILNKNEKNLSGKKFRLNWYDSTNLVQAGESWRFTVRVKRPNGFMNPGGFDYEGLLFQQGINATGYVREATRLKKNGNSLMHWVHRGRHDLYRKIGESIRELNPVIPALGLGIKDDLDSVSREVLARSGTSHLVAISGLHIGLIAGLAFFIGRWLWSLPVITLRWFPATKAGALCAIIAAASYTALAGFSIPTQRAFLMVLMFMLYFLLNRQISKIDVLFIALLVVLLFTPSSVLSVGFWLSFSAVGIIFYTVSGRTAVAGIWHQALRVHFILAIGLAPLLLLFFSQNPILGPVANIVAVPVIGVVITPLVLMGLLLFNLVEPIGVALLTFADYLLDGFWHYLVWIAESPMATITGVVTSTGVLISSILGILLLLIPRGLPGRWLGFLCLLPMIMIRPVGPVKGSFEFTLLDVGQGLAAVVRTQNHTLVFDTGPKFNANFDTGKAVVKPFLASLAIDHIDKVVISHGDNDHRGGYMSLTEEMEILETLTSNPEKLGVSVRNKNIKTCHRGQHWQWDGVDFTVLYPAKGASLANVSSNNNSCVLKVENAFHSLLLSGDIEAQAEALLISQDKSELNSDILIVPHHGSETSSTQPFIDAVSPSYALFPVGYRNRFGFPKDSVVSRYNEAKTVLLATAKTGAISFFINSDISKPDKYRQSHRHFWHRNHVE